MKSSLLVVFLILTLCFATFASLLIVGGQTPTVKYPTVTICIYRIQGIDPIEGFLEGDPDWHYYVRIWDGEQWLSGEGTVTGNDVIVNEFYSFTVKTISPTVEIWLLEDDTLSGSDVADISGYDGGGPDNYGTPPPRGAYYRAAYNLGDDNLEGDYVVLESGFWKTSGDYDGSVVSDENDANLWFQIWDNYDFPIAEAGPDKICYTHEKVNFDGSYSTASDGSSIVKYEWDFDGDGIVDAEGAKTSFSFDQKGEYYVKLTVTDSLGQTDSDYCVVTVRNRAPEASFTYTPTEITIKDTVSFYDTSQDEDGTIVSWFWDFGDGTNSTLQNPTHKFSSKGSFQVTLTVTDNDGATDTITQEVIVINLPPEASFEYTPSNPYTNNEVQFIDKSTDPEGIPIVSWHWDFGDGYTSDLQNPTHIFMSEGDYNVTLTVWDDENATDTYSMVISVTKPPPTQTTVPIPLWVIGLVIAIIFACGISAMYVWRKRRKTTAT